MVQAGKVSCYNPVVNLSATTITVDDEEWLYVIHTLHYCSVLCHSQETKTLS
jgi:hypothetical protein